MSNSQIATLLMGVLGIMFFILIILIGIYVIIRIKSKNKQKEDENEENVSSKSKVEQMYNLKSIFNFMEFDKIEDNMIVQKKGKKFIMIVKCQGINYDLMSGVEKSGVEQGFIQYLNSLRYPIQIYIQTRTVDLTGSISTYKQKIRKLGDDLAHKEFDYNQKVRSGQYNRKQLEKERFELVKARNLYEYGTDIVANTERMSLNKSILTKQYYIVLSYYPEEVSNSNYSADEISGMAFSELYTRAQTTINLMSVCGVAGKILDSYELAELLYSAYNRDEAENYDLQKAINSGYDSLYVTAPDVLEKRKRELDKQIEIDAINMANRAVDEVRQETELEKEVRKREEEYNEMVARMAELVLENNQDILGKSVVNKAKQKVNDLEKANDEKDKNKEEVVNEQKKVKRAGRPRKTA